MGWPGSSAGILGNVVPCLLPAFMEENGFKSQSSFCGGNLSPFFRTHRSNGIIGVIRTIFFII